MKKVFGQTVRDLKREVNKKVLKVPGIEQKVLDATSNEPWGPHGSHLAEIAHATRNYHEYQLIMSVIWKRINDTGKNWRHVYKGLTVLEYLVAHGAERVIDEIWEHAHQISTLSDFQYIDSSGRDQGSNVRKKSQSLVALVNDKERIQEVRQKASVNQEKYHGTTGNGDRYDDRYGGRDAGRNGYDRERDGAYRGDERHGPVGDPYSRDGDRYSRDSEHGRDSNGDDDYKGGKGREKYHYNSKTRSSDGDRDHSINDDGDNHYSSGHATRDAQNVGAPPSYEEATRDAQSPAQAERDGEMTEASKAPSSSEPKTASSPESTDQIQIPAAVGALVSPHNKEAVAFDEFDPRCSVQAAPPAASSMEMDLFGSLSTDDSISAVAVVPVTSATSATESDLPTTLGFSDNFLALSSEPSATSQSSEDPFGTSPFKATPQESLSVQPQSNAATTFFQPTPGSLGTSEPLPGTATNVETGFGFDLGNSFHGVTYASSMAPNSQPAEKPASAALEFSPPDLPVAQPSNDILADLFLQTGPASANSSQNAPVAAPTRSQTAPPDLFNQSAFSSEAVSPNPFATSGIPSQETPPNPFAQSGMSSQAAPPNPFTLSDLSSQAAPNPFTQSGLSPQAAPNPFGQSGLSSQAVPPNPFIQGGLSSQAQTPPLSHLSHPGLASQGLPPDNATQPGLSSQATPNLLAQSGSSDPLASQAAPPTPFILAGLSSQTQIPVPSHVSHPGMFVQGLPPNNITQPGLPSQATTPGLAQSGLFVPPASQAAPSSTSGTPTKPLQSKFEPKSAVWADTLSRGLVDLNISGPKSNPLADIGVDFDTINRKEKRKEKSTATPVSTITMGKAMGSGSGIGRTGATGMTPSPNPMMNPGMGMGMGNGMGMGMGGMNGMGGMGSMGGMGGMGGYGVMNQPMAMGMGMGMNMNLGVGMYMGMGQGAPMQPGSGMPAGQGMSGAAYNPMMAMGGNGPQQQYGGGYR